MLTLRWLAAAVLALAGTAHAQTATRADAPATRPAASAPAGTAWTDGEVRKIDKAQAKLTLRHAAIASLEMPPMTMVFKLADPKLLDTLKEGDKVRFRADRVNGAIVVTAIEPLGR